MQQLSSTTSRPPRQKHRVLLNLMRMFTGLLLGLWFVRLLLGFGAEAAGAILLLGTGIGISAIVQQLLEMSLTPALGLAYQTKEQERLHSAYCSAYLASFLVCGISLLLFALLGALLHRMEIPAELLWGARWFVTAKAVQTFVVCMLSPHTTMYLVQSNFKAYNLNLLSERLCDVLSVVGILLVGVTDHGLCIAAFGGLSALLRCSYLIVSSRLTKVEGQISLAGFRSVTWENSRCTLRALRENLLIVIANTAFLRLDQICVNLAGGLQANLLFSIATQLVGYIRLLTHGQAIGLEATAAKIYIQNQNQPAALNQLMRVSSRHQAILVLPAVCLLGFLVEPIMHVWLGTNVEKVGDSVAILNVIARLLLIGMTMRALTEGWMRILNGTGHTSVYARPSLLGACMNAVLAPIAILIAPGDIAIYIAAGLFAVLHLIVHIIWIPLSICRLTETYYWQLWRPLARPFAMTIVCAPILALGNVFSDWNATTLCFVASFYITAYAVGTFYVSLNPGERAVLSESVARVYRPKHALTGSANMSNECPSQAA